MSLDKLNKYKINKAFTEGVDIVLDDAPDVVFKVKLPGQYNRAYIADIYQSVDIDYSNDGAVTPKGNVMDARQVQIDAFVEHCLVSIDGEPVPQNFAEEYLPAIEDLMVKASELVESIQTLEDEAVKKSQLSSAGKIAGVMS